MHEVTEEVIDQLRSKHPKAAPLYDDGTIPPSNDVQPVIFEEIDIEAIQSAAKGTFGSGGPTQLDADGWKHILCSKSYGTLSEQLCQAIADISKRLCTEDVDHLCLSEFLSCRLIPLGLRPIRVGEVLRRIIGKVVTKVLKRDIIYASGTLQTCAGLESGIEAAVHAMANIFHDPSSEALLLVDAQNAFNNMNRITALNSVKSICPPFIHFNS